MGRTTPTRRLGIRRLLFAAILAGLGIACGTLILWPRIARYTHVRAGEQPDSLISSTHKRWGLDRHQLDGAYDEYWWAGGPKRVQGTYADGQCDGLWTFFDDRGEIVAQERWRRGVLVEHRRAPPWRGRASDE